MIHRHHIRVRYGETDKMSVVHHSVYPLYFEEARTELMRALGYAYSEIESAGTWFPLTDIGISFFRGARYDDLLVLEARLTELGRVRFRIDYRVLLEETGEVLAEGFTKHASTNSELRPRRLPPHVREAFEGALEEEPEAKPSE
jgi:acyl-CoA thioester hydrolase